MNIRKARSVVWNGQILFGQEVALYFQRHIVVLDDALLDCIT